MAKSNSAVQQRGGFGKFFRCVKAELKKVVWPTKKELINYGWENKKGYRKECQEV